MGVRYLLDTHVLLWLLGEPAQIRAGELDELTDPTNELVVSAASALEVATKVRLGKLQATALVADWSARLAELGSVELPISTTHALAAGALEWDHRDPFDRLLVAQALCENLVVVTKDRAILAVPGVRRLTW